MANGGGGNEQHHPLSDAHIESRTPDRFAAWMRTRATGTRGNLNVCGIPAAITSASAGTGSPDPAAEYASWQQLRDAVRTALNGDTAAACTLLPPEIAAAEWLHHGRRTRIRQPGAAARAIRCARRGIKALTPLPLLGALSQPLAGGATAAGILLAPIPLTSPHDPPPYSMAMPGRTLNGEINRPAPRTIAGTHPVTPAIGPAAPLIPAAPTPTPLILTAPADSTARDTAPAPITYTPTPAPQRTIPTVSPTPTVPSSASPDPTPSPTTTNVLDYTPPSSPPSGTPTGTSTPSPTTSPSPSITPTAKHTHHRHHKHPLRRSIRHR